MNPLADVTSCFKRNSFVTISFYLKSEATIIIIVIIDVRDDEKHGQTLF